VNRELVFNDIPQIPSKQLKNNERKTCLLPFHEITPLQTHDQDRARNWKTRRNTQPRRKTVLFGGPESGEFFSIG
jgi:hypothetical protein